MNKVNIKKALPEAAKGLFTGAAMIVPGMSGGTMALIFGFYHRLVDSASNIFKDFKKNFLTLLFYVIFIGGGFVLFSGVMEWLMGRFPLPVYSFFTGAILGGIPLIFKQAKTSSKVKFYDALYPVLGAAVVFLLGLIPEDALNISLGSSIWGYVVLLVAGVFLAAALVLPGISFSHMMLVLGIYEPFVTAIKELDILYLLPIALSVLIGVFVVVKVMDKAMKRFTKQTFLIIIGFVAASAADIIIESVLPLAMDKGLIYAPILAAALGFAVIFLISRKEEGLS